MNISNQMGFGVLALLPRGVPSANRRYGRRALRQDPGEGFSTTMKGTYLWCGAMHDGHLRPLLSFGVTRAAKRFIYKRRV